MRAYSNFIDRVSAFGATELGVTFPASFEQWERMQVDPETGEIIGVSRDDSQEIRQAQGSYPVWFASIAEKR